MTHRLSPPLFDIGTSTWYVVGSSTTSRHNIWSFKFLLLFDLLLRRFKNSFCFYFVSTLKMLKFILATPVFADTWTIIVNSCNIIAEWFFFSVLKINHDKSKILIVVSPSVVSQCQTFSLSLHLLKLTLNEQRI